MQNVFEIIFTVLAAILSLLCGYKIFQIFQLSSYKTKGVYVWAKQTKFDYFVRFFALGFLAFVGMLVFYGCFKEYENINYLGALFFIGFCAVFIAAALKEKKKTPLKVTYRVLRSMVISFILFAALYFGLLRLSRLFETVSYSITAIGLVLIPFVVILAHLIMSPFEKLNNTGYKLRAEKKLMSLPSLIKIAITGSYGKTTAKYILAKMLEKKYSVSYSPHSYNTPIGLSKVINNDLNESHEVFIAEMGARNIGDIKELALMVKPDYAMITAIGGQHLETFGSIENVIKAKSELYENISEKSLTVFNGESPAVRDMYINCRTAKIIASAKDTSDCPAYYKNVKAGVDGTSFTMVLNGAEYKVKTALLGKHVPSLIVLSAVLASALGVSGKDIAAAVAELKPVPHRLELIKKSEDTIVIDDAYNSNPEGAKNALEVLGSFENYTKVIVTPGLVELGESAKDFNAALGREIAVFADYAFLLGSNAKDILAGAVEKGMDTDKIVIVKTLDEAVKELAKISGKKAVLFENDLPDNY